MNLLPAELCPVTKSRWSRDCVYSLKTAFFLTIGGTGFMNWGIGDPLIDDCLLPGLGLGLRLL